MQLGGLARLPRPPRVPTRARLAGAQANAGTFNVAFNPSPSQGGAVILSAFRNNGSSVIGISEMASTSAATSITTPSATSQASGSSFVIDVLVQYGGTITVSDSKGNTYSEHLVVSNYSGAYDLVRFVCLNGAGGSAHTATVSSSGGPTEITMFFTEITNCTQMAGTSVGTVDGTSPITSPDLEVTAPQAILLAAVSGDSFSSNHSFPATGYTGLEVEPAADGNHAQGATAYRTVP